MKENRDVLKFKLDFVIIFLIRRSMCEGPVFQSLAGSSPRRTHSDPRSAEGWLKPTPLVQMLNPHHSPSRSIKSSFQIKKKQVIFCRKDVFASTCKAIKFGQHWRALSRGPRGPTGRCSIRAGIPPASFGHSSLPQLIPPRQDPIFCCCSSGFNKMTVWV